MQQDFGEGGSADIAGTHWLPGVAPLWKNIKAFLLKIMAKQHPSEMECRVAYGRS